MTKNVFLSGVAIKDEKECPTLEHDFSIVDEFFKRSQTSSYGHLIESKGGSFFPLHLFNIMGSEELINSIVDPLDFRFFNKSFFIISDNLFNWVPLLLSKGAFDVMVSPLRGTELIGKLHYYFSESYQTNLLKNSTHFQFDLTKKEQKLFDFLIDHPKGVTREQLMTICWKNISVHPKTLDVHLFNLRQKIESVGGVINFRDGRWLLYFNLDK